ncbi:MAG TPA: hypothetical protein VKV73_19360 [Chloroflexota bacterium]|nr:hypothetical protein [Chloroflexota bacterium]
MTTPPIDPAQDVESLLTRWAGSHRLTDAQASAIRAAILQSTSEPQVELDAEWFWGLLRPVTGLLDGPNQLHHRLSGLISFGA